MMPRRINNCLLSNLQERLVKMGARLIKRAWYYWLSLAGGGLTGPLTGHCQQASRPSRRRPGDPGLSWRSRVSR